MNKITFAPKWLIDISIHWPIFSLALWVCDSFFDGINLQNITSLLTASFILTTLNLFIKPVILLLTLPLAVLSLGLIIPFLNGLFIVIVAKLVDGFYVDSYFTSLLVAISISFLSILTQIAIGTTNTSLFIKKRNSKHTNDDMNQSSHDEKNIIDVQVKEKNK